VDECLEIARGFLKARRKVDVDLDGFGEMGLYGLKIFVRDAVEEDDGNAGSHGDGSPEHA
jgi:hypothetical protein